ncbi:MAG: 6-phosphofructokinase [Firmicutes bacterium]|nr:6-phosphofructokinase [Bacillota bacterium]
MKTKNIAILTSGGDAPGMNAAIRAAVRYGIYEGLRVFGVKRGYAGLLDGDMEELSMRSVSDIVQRGGTILRTARCAEFMTKEGQERGAAFLRENGIDGLIVIGGDGTLMGAKALCECGIKAVGIPGTIDNDLAYTQYTLGFDTACNTVLDAINKLRDTMSSHDRICIVEVMGRNCGDIALMTGIGGGAEIILVPEIHVEFEQIMAELDNCRARGKYSSIIVLAEGAGYHTEELRARIAERMGGGVRATVLGHLQRGGSPSSRDRFLGTSWGVQAVRLLKNGMGGRICGIRKDCFFDMDIGEGLSMKKEFDFELYRMAEVVSNSTL